MKLKRPFNLVSKQALPEYDMLHQNIFMPHRCGIRPTWGIIGIDKVKFKVDDRIDKKLTITIYRSLI